MFALLGSMFGYSFQDCLNLPVRAFFKLYEQARIMEARQYKELLLIERTNQTKEEFFQYMHDRYMAIIYPEASELPPKPKDPLPQSDEGLDGKSESVRNMMTSFAQKLRRAKGLRG
jgi:hypothetical protein